MSACRQEPCDIGRRSRWWVRKAIRCSITSRAGHLDVPLDPLLGLGSSVYLSEHLPLPLPHRRILIPSDSATYHPVHLLVEESKTHPSISDPIPDGQYNPYSNVQTYLQNLLLSQNTLLTAHSPIPTHQSLPFTSYPPIRSPSLNSTNTLCWRSLTCEDRHLEEVECWARGDHYIGFGAGDRED